MEPKLNINQNKDDSKVYNDPLGFKESNTAERQNRFLSLRKNKKMRIAMPKTEDEKIKEKYELNQNSFDASDSVIQNFFNSQEKTAVLYDLISNKNFNNMNIGNSEIKLIKFIIVQCINYYKSEEDNKEALKKFFTDTILTNLIDIMNIFKKDNIIVYNISRLLEKLTDDSYSITKLITLNSSSLQKIFDCLSFVNLEVAPEILKLIYNCYITDEEAVNPNCNIGVFVFDSLNKFISENDVEKNKIFLNSPYFKILISFLDLLINDNTKEVYKNFDSFKKNNIIFVLLVLCRDTLDENLKLDSHAGLKKLLDIIKDENELDVRKFGICEIVSTFLPHIKLESNNPEIVLYSMKILDKFSYLCDTHEFIKLDLINQIEQILLTFIDMNENRSNPKLFYKNYSKAIIGDILSSISYIILNSMADYDDPDLKNEWQDYIVNQTRIIEYLTSCLKINDIEEENLVNVYGFFKDFLDDGVEKDRFLKLILSNFIEIGLVENLKNNLINKKYGIIQEILEISLMMLQKADKLKGDQVNFIRVYLEKKGFVEMLTTIEGNDFGNSKNSELAQNIRENFLK
jgi:hypothetical protein